MEAKKIRSVTRMLLLMLRKGIAESKILVELHMMLKRGRKAIGKHHLDAAFTCRDTDTPHLHEYEFSCSNSPAPNFQLFHRKRIRGNHSHFISNSNYNYNAAKDKVLEIEIEMWNNHYENSPLVTLPGFGKSPVVRQLRVTDSPFPLKDDESGDSQVDMAAQQFITNFYKHLKFQNRMATASACP